MALMVMREPDQENLEETGYLSICDPTCGSGCLLIAAGWACEAKHKMQKPNDHLFFVGQDLDRVVALMCCIQLSILGYAGYVIVGDSMTKPITGEGLIVDAIRDYARILRTVCFDWELDSYIREMYEIHAYKLERIAEKYQAGSCHDYDKAVELCKKKKRPTTPDSGIDAL